MAVIQEIFILYGSQCTLRLCSRIYSLSVPGGFVALACLPPEITTVCRHHSMFILMVIRVVRRRRFVICRTG